MSWMFLKKCVTLSLWSLVAQSPSFFLSWPRLRSAPTYQENFVTLNLEFLDQMKWCIMNGVESNITCIISNQKSQVHSWSIGPYIGTSRSLWIRLWTGHDSGLPNGLVVTTNSFPFFEFDFFDLGLELWTETWTQASGFACQYILWSCSWWSRCVYSWIRCQWVEVKTVNIQSHTSSHCQCNH